MHGGALPEIINKNVFLSWQVGSRRSPSRTSQRNMLFRVESVRSFFVCFQTTIFLREVARCCIGTFSRHAVGFRIIFRLAGLDSLLGVVLTFFRLWVCLLTFFFVDGCCVGTHSGHNTSLQTMFHAAGLFGREHGQSSASSSSPPSRPSASSPPQENQFFDDPRTRPPVYFDPKRTKHFFRRFLEGRFRVSGPGESTSSRYDEPVSGQQAPWTFDWYETETPKGNWDLQALQIFDIH